jgi:hypothetical protein
LRNTPEGPRLSRLPVKEIAELRGRSYPIGPCDLTADNPNPFAGVAGELLEIHAELESAPDSVLEFEIRGLPLHYDAAKQELEAGGVRVPVPLLDGRLELTVLTDRTMFTIFANHGLTYLPLPHIARENQRTLNLHTTRGAAKLNVAQVFELRSIWVEQGVEAGTR